jgi:hypothetical protein
VVLPGTGHIRHGTAQDPQDPLDLDGGAPGASSQAVGDHGNVRPWPLKKGQNMGRTMDLGFQILRHKMT